MPKKFILIGATVLLPCGQMHDEKSLKKSALQVNSIPAFSLRAVGVLRATKANDKLLVTSGA